MIRHTILPAILLLAACENGTLIPDLRNTGSTLVAAPAVAPAAVPTSTVQLSDKQRFVAAIEANGCVINAGTVGPILTQASINQTQLANLSVELENEGALAPDGTDTVRLSSPNCI